MLQSIKQNTSPLPEEADYKNTGTGAENISYAVARKKDL